MKSLQAIRNKQLLGMVTRLGRKYPDVASIPTLMRLPYLSFAVREGTMKVIIKTLIAAGADVFRGDLLHSAA